MEFDILYLNSSLSGSSQLTLLHFIDGAYRNENAFIRIWKQRKTL